MYQSASGVPFDNNIDASKGSSYIIAGATSVDNIHTPSATLTKGQYSYQHYDSRDSNLMNQGNYLNY